MTTVPRPGHIPTMRRERLYNAIALGLTAEPAAQVNLYNLTSALMTHHSQAVRDAGRMARALEAVVLERIIETLSEEDARLLIDDFRGEGWIVSFDEDADEQVRAGSITVAHPARSTAGFRGADTARDLSAEMAENHAAARPAPPMAQGYPPPLMRGEAGVPPAHGLRSITPTLRGLDFLMNVSDGPAGDLEQATGEALDSIGATLGVERMRFGVEGSGLFRREADDEYRHRLSARVFALMTNG